MDLLGGRAGREHVRALVFNTKGEDLLHVDRPNSEFDAKPDAREQWRSWASRILGRFSPFACTRPAGPRRRPPPSPPSSPAPLAT